MNGECKECGDVLESSRSIGSFCCYECWALHQTDERGRRLIWIQWYEFCTTHGDPDHPANEMRDYSEEEANAHILDVTGLSFSDLQQRAKAWSTM